MTEHYITLFDHAFLTQGIVLQRSLARHDPDSHLWILCMDEEVEEALRRLALPGTTLIPLREAETDALRAVKADRNRGEYCWTQNPFTPGLVFERAHAATRATYLDADMFFFDTPRKLLREMDDAGKDVMITEHAYDPLHDFTKDCGRFCVQFMPFRKTARAETVLRRWQEQCLEWCYGRIEPGRYGDQKYLDEWPEMFADTVHVLQRPELTLGPWNVEKFLAQHGPALRPVLYHYAGLRLTGPGRANLFPARYALGEPALAFYDQYLVALHEAAELRRRRGLSAPVPPGPGSRARRA